MHTNPTETPLYGSRTELHYLLQLTLAREQRESAAAASVAQRAIRQQEKEDAERAANGAPTRSHTSGAQKRARTDPVLGDIPPRAWIMKVALFSFFKQRNALGTTIKI